MADEKPKRSTSRKPASAKTDARTDAANDAAETKKAAPRRAAKAATSKSDSAKTSAAAKSSPSRSTARKKKPAPERVADVEVPMVTASDRDDAAAVQTGDGQSTRSFDPAELDDAIRRQAYELYLSRAGGDGDPLSDWFEAERLVRARPEFAARGSQGGSAPETNRGVERGDHNPEGARKIAEGRAEDREDTRVDSADRHGHGAHGRGGSSEHVRNAVDIEPDFSRDSDRGGSAGWGAEASGGSVIDKRSPER